MGKKSRPKRSRPGTKVTIHQPSGDLAASVQLAQLLDRSVSDVYHLALEQLARRVLIELPDAEGARE